MTVKIEKYAFGKWDVRTRGDYPRRVGHIVGGNRRYLAEMGPDRSLGYFETLKGAAAVIEGVAREIENAPDFYTLPEGWTWTRVYKTRVRFDIAARFFPIASARVVIAWGRPIEA